MYGRVNAIPIPESHPTTPICAYGASKLAVEKYLHIYQNLWGLNSVALRIANPFGPGQLPKPGFGVIATFAKKVIKGEPITIFGDGSVVRDYLFIDDLVDAILAAGARVRGAEVINIGSGQGYSLLELIKALHDQLGHKPDVRFESSRSFDVPVCVLDITKAKSELDWTPKTSLQNGIATVLNAYSASKSELR